MKTPETTAGYFWARVRKGPDCWTWTGTRSFSGYGQVSFASKKTLAHRLSWQLHFGEIPDGKHVCHSCDNRLCVRPDHLWLGTNADNVADRVAKGRTSRVPGDLNGRARLTEAQVRELRKLPLLPMATRDVIAQHYGVPLSTLKNAYYGITWKHLPLRALDEP
jgi:hypothetical protein